MAHTPPKIQQVQDELVRAFRENRWKAGDKLPTDAELAAQFDCGLGTIGRALALLAHDGWVERKTRVGTRVLRTGAEMVGVQLDAVAFVYPSTQHEGIWKMAKGFQDAARAAGRRVVMLSTGTDYQKEAEYIGRLSEFDVRGAMTCPNISSPEEQVQFSQLLVHSKFPVVLGGTHLPGLGCSAVSVDGFHVGYTMTRHLLAQGLRRIGFFAHLAWIGFTHDSYRGYCWALEEAGITERTEWSTLEPSTVLDFDNPVRESIGLGRNFLARSAPLQAVVAASDFLALGLMEAAQERGLRVPEDLKITGADDFLLGLQSPIPLTTYHVPYEEIGQRSFALLHKRVLNHNTPARLESVRGHIVTRASA